MVEHEQRLTVGDERWEHCQSKLTMATVILRTESGKWEMVALVRDDPVFSQLVPDLPDEMMEGEVITLSASVAEILEEEWSHYQRLLLYIEALRNEEKERLIHWYGKKAHEHTITEGAAAQPPSITGIITSSSSVRRRPRVPLVYLHQVARLSLILNMPVNWEFFVGVSYESPQQQRIHHLLAMGRVVPRLNLERESDIQAVPFSPYDIVANLTSIRRWIVNHTKSPDAETYMAYLWGLTRNGALRSLDEPDRDDMSREERSKLGGERGSHGIYWETILWGDIEPALESLRSSKRSPKLPTRIANTANLLSGRGDPTLESDMASECVISDSSMSISDYNVVLLYKTLLLSFPEDIDPVAFGLGPIVSSKPSGGDVFKKVETNLGDKVMTVSQMVPWIHFNTLLLIPLYRAKPKNDYKAGKSIPGTMKLTEDLFPVVVELVGETLGLHSLTRMLLSLLHYMQRLEGTRKKASPRAEEFARVIEEYLSGREGYRGLVALPKKELVASLSSKVR